MEECLAFLRYVNIMCYAFEYNVYYPCIVHYLICRSSIVLLEKLVLDVFDSKFVY